MLRFYTLSICLLILLSSYVDSQIITCIQDDFEDGTVQLLNNECDGVRPFVVRDYADDDIDSPDGSSKYLGIGDGGADGCLVSGVVRVRNGVRFQMSVMSFHDKEETPAARPICEVVVNSATDGTWVASNSIPFGNTTNFIDVNTLMTRPALATIRVQCTGISEGVTVAIDNVKINAFNAIFCDELFPEPTTTTTTVTTITTETTSATETTSETETTGDTETSQVEPTSTEPTIFK